MDSQKYQETLHFCKSFFKHELGGLEIKTLVLFGSAAYSGCFNIGTSDLDIVALTNRAVADNLDGIVEVVRYRLRSIVKEWVKYPHVVRDGAGNRVEFSIIHQGTVLDCKITRPVLPACEELKHSAVYDSTDIVIGAIVRDGIVIAGDKSDLDKMSLKYLPYYDDTVRNKRLQTIKDYLAPKEAYIKNMLKDDQSKAIEYFFAYREMFLKWIFCYYRFFPVSLNKHLGYQLDRLMNSTEDYVYLDLSDKRTLMLEWPHPIHVNIAAFLDLYDHLCGQWEQWEHKAH